MRKLAMAAGLGMALTLSACGGGDSSTQANDVNAMGVDNMALDMNGMDANAMDGMAGMDANGAVDANTANMMEKDATTHDPDTNLANGI
jgi:hypothetical protein